MNRIERDLSEISALRSTLQDDREYTSRLRTSLQDETVRLRELQAKILTQVIHNPPESLTAQAQSAGRATSAIARAPEPEEQSGRAPEIIVPSAGKSKASKGTTGTAGTARDTKAAGAASATGATGGRASKSKADDAAPARSDGAKGGKRAKDGDAPADESFNFTFVQK